MNNKSEILLNEYEINEIKKRILKNENREINFKLIISKDLDKIKIHYKYDNIRKVLALIRTIKGKKFGGFIKACFNSSSTYKKNDNAFIIKLDNFKIIILKKEIMLFVVKKV